MNKSRPIELVSIAFDSLAVGAVFIVGSARVRLPCRSGTSRTLRVLVLDHGDLFDMIARRNLYWWPRGQYGLEFLEKPIG